MARINWRKTYEWIRELKEWIAIVLPGILAAFAINRWLGWGIADSLSAGFVAMLLVAFLVMRFQLKRDTRVIDEIVDPDFGELTRYHDSWLSILDLEASEEPLFLSGKGTREPTMIQRSSLIEIIDTWPQWNRGLEVALDRMKGNIVPESPRESFILSIELDPYEARWAVSFVVSKGKADYDFIAKFCQGRLVQLKRDEI
ncbi:MAG: hypothetical protein P1U90_15490 [Akkermansiaceae bacterium]|nr:hypothetical protein [Akkermansiaceae bacterium]